MHTQLNSFLKLCLLAVCLSVTACGFHLRGTSSLDNSDKIVFVDAPYGTFEQQLKDDLRLSGVQLNNDKLGVDWNIKVSQARVNREIATLNERGTVDSYKLNFTVIYSVFDDQNKLIKAPQTLVESRQYVYNSVAVIESEFEEQALRESMEKDIAKRIVRQLSDFNGS